MTCTRLALVYPLIGASEPVEQPMITRRPFDGEVSHSIGARPTAGSAGARRKWARGAAREGDILSMLNGDAARRPRPHGHGQAGRPRRPIGLLA